MVVMEGTPHFFLLSPMPSLANFSYVNLYPSAKNKASLKEFRQWPQLPRTPPSPPPSAPTTEPPSISVILTVYKRNRLAEQLAAIAAQSVTPAAVYVFQNENHVDIPMASLIHKYRDEPWPLHHIHSVTMNQKYHGRFAFANMISTEHVAIFDDDKIPGTNWLKHALALFHEKNAIIGYSGRLWGGRLSYHIPIYNGEETVEVDYIGQCSVLRTDTLRFLWHDSPVTLTNAEDMQLSAAALVHGGTRTFVASQPSSDNSTWCSLYPEYGVDKFASSKLAGVAWVYERVSIMNYMVEHRNWQPLLYRDPVAFFNSAAEADKAVGNGWAEEVRLTVSPENTITLSNRSFAMLFSTVGLANEWSCCYATSLP